MKNKHVKAIVEALQIFDKYMSENQYFVHCEHDRLHIAVEAKLVSETDQIRLLELGFREDENGIFFSTRYGSC